MIYLFASSKFCTKLILIVLIYESTSYFHSCSNNNLKITGDFNFNDTLIDGINTFLIKIAIFLIYYVNIYYVNFKIVRTNNHVRNQYSIISNWNVCRILSMMVDDSSGHPASHREVVVLTFIVLHPAPSICCPFFLSPFAFAARPSPSLSLSDFFSRAHLVLFSLWPRSQHRFPTFPRRPCNCTRIAICLYVRGLCHGIFSSAVR